MSVIEILDKLKAVGFSVSSDSQDILLDGDAVLDDDLRQAIQANKQELLFHLRTAEYARLTAQARELASWLDDTSVPYEDRWCRIAEFKKLANRIAELQPHIDYYQRSGLDRWYGEGWLLIHSEILGEIVCVIRNEDVRLPPGTSNYPTYLFAEIEVLSGSSEGQIREAHKIKKAFNGEVVKAQNLRYSEKDTKQ